MSVRCQGYRWVCRVSVRCQGYRWVCRVLVRCQGYRWVCRVWVRCQGYRWVCRVLVRCHGGGVCRVPLRCHGGGCRVFLRPLPVQGEDYPCCSGDQSQGQETAASNQISAALILIFLN